MTPAEVSAALLELDQHRTAIQVTGALALFLGFVQWAELIRLGFRDKTHAFPLVAILFNLSNDVNYSLLYNRWFNVIHHDMFITQWYLIFPFTILELIVCWQLVHYSREEVFPGFSKLQAWAAMILLGAGMFAIHRYIGTTSDDYLGQKTNMMTLLMSNMGIYLLIRRRSSRGQSMLLALTLVVCAGFPQMFIHFPAMGPAFRTQEYFALATVVTLTSLIYPVMLARQLRRERRS